MAEQTQIGLDGRPAHLRSGGANEALWPRLVREANFERGLFGVPIYLCGSALFDFNANPRDWDIRLRLEDDDFAARFGDPETWRLEGNSGLWTAVRWRWSDECVKRSHQWSAKFRSTFDVQIYPASHWDDFYGNAPRLRLDSREDPS